MLFNSIEFGIFLPIVFCLYWFVLHKPLKAQNFLLLIVSYIFYGWWDWRFLSLIAFSSFIDFTVGIQLGKTETTWKRNALLLTSILVNIGFLFFFKYYNFFAESFAQAYTLMGTNFSPSRLNIILPVGISFYTFQTLSYTIDIYKRKLQPTQDIIAFFAFVSFFPQLVAGPIERASNLLPQFFKARTFNYAQAVDGMRQILWGLFKKVVIADNCAIYVNDIFQYHTDYSGSTLLLGAFLFAFQIYGDFSGYSDIAIGTARLFGFNLMRNFAFPYFSRDIAEFWRRWHISLSTWFRDYLYIPLGGSKVGTLTFIRNIFIIFIVSGFWHGANWTFIIWGALHATFFLPLMLFGINRKNLNVISEERMLPTFKEFIQIIITFLLVLIAWVFFRAASVQEAISYLSIIFSPSLIHLPYLKMGGSILNLILLIGFILFLLSVEWLQRHNQHGLEMSPLTPLILIKGRVILYFVLSLAIIFCSGQQQDFIYFQF